MTLVNVEMIIHKFYVVSEIRIPQNFYCQNKVTAFFENCHFNEKHL